MEFLLVWIPLWTMHLLLAGVALVALHIVLVGLPCLIAMTLEKCGLSEGEAWGVSGLLTIALAISFLFASCSVRA